MKPCIKCGETKQIVEFYKNKGMKDGHVNECIQCRKLYEKDRHNKNYEKNKTILLQRTNKHYKENREYYVQKKREKYVENREIISQKNKKYREEKPHIQVQILARRRAAKLQQTPKWLTEDQKQEMRDIYKLAKEMSIRDGIRYEVDHIIPIKGKEARGLHVPWNLQILEKTQNIKKGNKIKL